MAGAEKVLKLFDSYWFEHKIFSTEPSLSTPEPDPVLEIHEELAESKLCRIPTLHVRSHSDHCLSSRDSSSSDSLSPNSVLLTPKLQTILSGKEVGEFSDQPAVKQEEIKTPSKKKVNERRRRKGSSRSLSELEFEELKGFMDLGFVFSEEDKNSKLVSIIPGLQRLGRRVENGDDDHEGEVKAVGESAVSRPYLSEAWDALDQRKIEMNWRIPVLGNEMDMKDHLRMWAHSVASTVR